MTPSSSTDSLPLGFRERALAPYLRAIKAHRLVFTLVVIATVAAAAIWTSTASKQYSATAQILVTPLSQDNESFLGFNLLRDSGDPTRTVQTAAALIESRTAARRAAEALGDGRSAQEILDSVTIQPAGESNVLEVTATATTPSKASRTANAFTNSVLALRHASLNDELESAIERLETTRAPTPERERQINALSTLKQNGDPTLSVAQLAISSDSPLGPSAVIVLGLALLAGLAIATATAVVLEMTERRIRDEEEAVRLYPLPVLTRVPIIGPTELRRREFGAPSLQPGIRESFRTVMAQLQRESQRHVVMLTSGSTGDGKTTSSVNLAITAARGGHSTILLDADFRKPGVGQALGIDASGAGIGAFDDLIAMEHALVQVPDVENLRLLAPGADDQSDAWIDTFSERLPDVLQRAAELADYVVVDTAPLGEVGDALRITPYVNDVIVVVYPGKSNRANYEIMRDLLERAGDRPTGLLIVGDQTGASYTYYGYGMGSRS